MAIPSEYYTEQNQTSISGTTNMSHPRAIFYPYVARHKEESIGPLTNLRTGTVLHPDMHDTDPDRGRTNAAQHEHQFSTWLPGRSAAENIVVKGQHMATFEEFVGTLLYADGDEARYVMDMYHSAIGSPDLLTGFYI